MSARSKKYLQGFTLIELLIVLSIISILIFLIPVGFINAQKSARDARRKTDLEQIRAALEIYRNDCGVYPNQLNFGQSLAGPSQGVCANNIYMQHVPDDPRYSRNNYMYTSTGTTYALCAHMEKSSNEGLCGGSNCGNTCGTTDSTCTYSVCNP